MSGMIYMYKSEANRGRSWGVGYAVSLTSSPNIAVDSDCGANIRATCFLDEVTNTRIRNRGRYDHRQA